MSSIHKNKILTGFLIATIAALVSLQWLPLVNGIGLLCVACLAWLFRMPELNQWAKTGLFLALVIATFWVATYRPSGFSYPLLFELPGLDGEPRYKLFINTAKALVGFILLYLLWPTKHEGIFVARARYRIMIVLIAPALIIGLAIPVLNLELQVKAVEQIVLFAAANLLIISVAEETFMRLLLQQSLCNAVATFCAIRWVQESIALLIVTLLFVLIHSGISGDAVWIYALAGFLYGLSYTLSKNIFYPIVIHFCVNQIHFSVFTYPI